MITRRIRMLVAGTLIAICCKTVSGQGSSSVILNVNTENSVVYLDDVSDVSRFATNLNVTAAVVARKETNRRRRKVERRAAKKAVRNQRRNR